MGGRLRGWLRRDGAGEAARLADGLDGVIRTTHDASNALSTALINAEILRKGLEAVARGEAQRDDISELTTDLEGGLARLRELLEETKAIARAARETPESPRR